MQRVHSQQRLKWNYLSLFVKPAHSFWSRPNQARDPNGSKVTDLLEVLAQESLDPATIELFNAMDAIAHRHICLYEDRREAFPSLHINPGWGVSVFKTYPPGEDNIFEDLPTPTLETLIGGRSAIGSGTHTAYTQWKGSQS